MAHLKAVSAADVEPDAELLAVARSLVIGVEAGRITGLFAIAECGHISREPVWAGEIDPDGIAGFSARVLASIANAEA